MWGVPEALALSVEQRRTLEAWLAARNTPQKVVLRSRIVLLAASGQPNRRIAHELKTSRPTVILWRNRFAAGGPAALTQEEPGRGRRPRISAEKVKQIIEATLHSHPVDATHWSVRSMASAQDISPATVQRIWDAHGLQPHRTETFKLSRDKRFVEKLTDVVGLYLNPPEKALVLCFDEKSQMQALDRTQPGLPMKKGRCGTMTHDYKRHGTTTLFAALNVLEGTVIGECMSRHRHQEFKLDNVCDFTAALERKGYRLSGRQWPVQQQMHLTEVTLVECNPPKLHQSTCRVGYRIHNDGPAQIKLKNLST